MNKITLIVLALCAVLSVAYAVPVRSIIQEESLEEGPIVQKHVVLKDCFKDNHYRDKITYKCVDCILYAESTDWEVVCSDLQFDRQCSRIKNDVCRSEPLFG